MERLSATSRCRYVEAPHAWSARDYAIHLQVPDAADLTSPESIPIVAPHDTTFFRLDAESLAIEAERPLDDDFVLALVVP